MNRVIALLCTAVTACGGDGGTGPAGFDVDVRLETGVVGGTCAVTWTATATNPAIIVTYRVGTPSAWYSEGTFTNQYIVGRDFGNVASVAVRWELTAPEFSEARTVNLLCGQTWQEP